ncbi:MAG: alkaline phosphatase, partial [Armatimonadaceae bacterium]
TLKSENPCVRYHNSQRGYVRCTLTPKAWRSDFVTVDKVAVTDGKTGVRASFVVEAGRPGAQEA